MSNLIEVYIQRLRRKIDDGQPVKLIHTRRGAGYTLAVADDAGLMIDTVRGRLTLFCVTVLAAALVVVGGLIYVLLARALYGRIDENLRAVVQIATTSLTNDLAEGQDYEDAARSTAAELSSRQQMLAIYDASGRLLAEGGRDDDLEITLPPCSTIPADEVMLLTVVEAEDDDDRHRLAVRRVSIPPADTPLSRRRRQLARADRRGARVAARDPRLRRPDRAGARRRRRLVPRATEPVAGRRDGRAGAADRRRESERATAGRQSARRARPARGNVQRSARPARSVADPAAAVHGRRLARAAHAGRDRREPPPPSRCSSRTATSTSIARRSTSSSSRRRGSRASSRTCSRWRGPTPATIRSAGRRCISTKSWTTSCARPASWRTRKQVSIELATIQSAAFTGDEDLIRRLIGNLLDNAVRHAPPGSTVRVDLTSRIRDAMCCPSATAGDGIPPEIQPHIFERFYRGDAARTLGSWRGRARPGAGALDRDGRMEEMSRWPARRPRARRSQRSCRAAAESTAAFICRSCRG